MALKVRTLCATTHPMNRELPLDPHDFERYYRYTPAALAIREVVRLQAVKRLGLTGPILDVGCGDGLFARMAYPDQQSWGVDINPSEVQRAQQSGTYATLICGSICNIHLPSEFFHSAIANCSLEHVPDISSALKNIASSLRQGGEFVMIVPTPDWDQRLLTAELMNRVGLKSLARAYGDTLNNVFAHIHLYQEARWREILAAAGFETVRCEPIALRDTSWAFDVMLYPSLLGYFVKKFTGRWVVSTALRPLTADLARGLINAIGRWVPDTDGAAEYMFICRKSAETP
jgi:SAM-dependent methyltransferase